MCAMYFYERSAYAMGHISRNGTLVTVYVEMKNHESAVLNIAKYLTFARPRICAQIMLILPT